MPTVDDLKIKLFADGADIEMIARMAANPLIKGFTTNPTLMRQAGVRDYRSFALSVLELVTDRPVSFEVFSDDFDEMEAQAREIASWGQNVFVKIPITNTKGESSKALVSQLSTAGVQINVTAMMTDQQVADIVGCFAAGSRNFVSVFAGRIADSGRDPMPIMRRSVEILQNYPETELIWASPRELLNVIQADAVGCHIITATDDVLKKLELIGKDLDLFSLETVQMFWRDARKAGYTIDTSQPAVAATTAARNRTTK